MSDKETANEKKTKEMFDDLYKKVEERIKELSEQVKVKYIPETEEKLKKNVFKTVLFSFGIGFILGIIVMAFGFKNAKKR